MESIGAKVYIDGAGEFTNDISTMIQATKTFKSELDAINKSDLNPFAKASLSKSALTKEIEAQEQKIVLLKEKLEETAEKYGENSTQAMKVTEQIEKANAALSTMKEQLNNIKNPVQIIGDQIKGWGDDIQKFGQQISKYGDWMTTRVTTPIVGAFTASAKEAIDFESAMAGVQKTVDETDTTKYEDLADSIKEMSGVTGLAKQELAGIMEIGGQLGITADNLSDFSRTIADLSVSTNLSAESAATDLARFMNITGDSQKDINRLASSVVALGNNFATSEAEILEMATRLASAGTIAGLSAPEVFALATAMSSVGIQAEAGGTAMTQTFTAIEKAVSGIDDKLAEKVAKAEKKVADKTFALEKAQAKYNQALEKSGPSSIAAQKALNNLEKAQANYNNILAQSGESGFAAQKAMDSLEKAQSKYNQAVQKYGENSEQAYQALQNVETAQKKYDESLTKTSANAQKALQDVENAQLKYDEAIANGSNKAELAAIDLQKAENDLADAQKTLALLTDGSTSDLQKFADVAGMTADQFTAAWRNDPMSAITAFIQGLSQMDEGAEGTTATLAELGLEGVRQSNMLKSLALASDQLTGATELSNRAYNENTALIDEANKRYSTHENQIKALKERLGNLAIEVGERLLPYLDRFIDFADRMMAKWDGLDEGTQNLILKGALLVAAIGPVLSIGGRLITGVGLLVSGFGTLVGSVGGIIGAISGIGTAAISAVGGLGSIGAAIGAGGAAAGGGLIAALGSLAAAAAPFLIGGAIIAGIGFAVYEVVKHWDEIKEAAGNLARWVGEKWDDIKDSTSKAWDKVKTDVSSAWDNMKKDTESASDNIGTKISTTWDEIKTNTSRTWDTVKRAVGDAADDMKRNMVDAAQTIWDKVSGAFSDLASNAWSWGSNIIDQLGNGVNSAWGWVESSVSGMGRFITDTLSGLAGKAWSWGSDLVGGLRDGIDSKINAVKGAADTVAGWISKYLHFSTPDIGPLADADEYMPDFMKLLAGGIYKNMGIVERAADTLAATLVPSFGGDIAAAGGNSTTINNGGATINVYGAEGQDVHELADIVVRELTSTLNRQALTYG